MYAFSTGCTICRPYPHVCFTSFGCRSAQSRPHRPLWLHDCRRRDCLFRLFPSVPAVVCSRRPGSTRVESTTLPERLSWRERQNRLNQIIAAQTPSLFAFITRSFLPPGLFPSLQSLFSGRVSPARDLRLDYLASVLLRPQQDLFQRPLGLLLDLFVQCFVLGLDVVLVLVVNVDKGSLDIAESCIVCQLCSHSPTTAADSPSTFLCSSCATS